MPHSFKANPDHSVYEAKRIAERATGVGDKKTDIIVLRPGNKVSVLPEPTVELLEKTYQELRARDLQPRQWRDLTEAFAKL